MRYSSAAGRWVLAATVLGSAMASIDSTVVGIALPSIGRDLGASFGALQWVVSGYLLALAAWLLPGGTLGDRFGRRRVFVVGVTWFAAASAACGAAPDVAVLVAMRALQGIGAALLVPGSLAIIEASFDPGDRGRAIGAWSGLGGLGTAAGPLLGGYLVQAASWRWIFLINVPVGVAVAAIALRHVPETRRPGPPARLDLPGAALAAVGLAGTTFGLIAGGSSGWSSAPALGALSLGAAALAAWAVVERHVREPMLAPSLLRRRTFGVTNAATFLVYAGLGGMLFLLPVDLEVVEHYSATEAGLSLLPVTVLMLALSARSGRLASRVGPRLQMSLGPVLIAAGIVLLVRATSGAGYLAGVLPAVLVLGLGLAATVAPLTATAMSALPDADAGIASAVNNDVARLGGLLAVALLPAIAGIVGRSYTDPGRFAGEFRVAVVVAACWTAAAGVVCAAALPGRRAPSLRPAPSSSLRTEGGATPPHHCALDAPPLRARARAPLRARGRGPVAAGRGEPGIGPCGEPPTSSPAPR